MKKRVVIPSCSCQTDNRLKRLLLGVHQSVVSLTAQVELERIGAFRQCHITTIDRGGLSNGPPQLTSQA